MAGRTRPLNAVAFEAKAYDQDYAAFAVPKEALQLHRPGWLVSQQDSKPVADALFSRDFLPACETTQRDGEAGPVPSWSRCPQ